MLWPADRYGLDYSDIKEFCGVFSSINGFSIHFLLVTESMFTDLEVVVKNIGRLISENLNTCVELLGI
ncbi:MAG: hypothetical protein LBS15_01450 [Endomicrobium sp.]|jgi:hypothetical protein|nr:hypothetical protein [Endomicrobium sp.]